MIHAMALMLIAVFLGLSGLHVYWAFGGTYGLAAAIPEIDGRPAFDPPVWMTAIVAVGLAACASLVAALIGIGQWPVGPTATRSAGYVLAGILALRTIGDFRFVGFTKRIRTSRFAQCDSYVYSPLCATLAVIVFLVAAASAPAP